MAPSPQYWRCINRTRGTALGHRIQKADTVLGRLCGLLPRKGLAPSEGLWILPCKDIHSVGMKFAFDAVFLDAQLQVVHLIHAMPPWRVSRYVKAARTVLELPAGTLHQTGTLLGDTLSIEPA